MFVESLDSRDRGLGIHRHIHMEYIYVCPTTYVCQ